ncbi:MAG: 4-alpha-glucanotransferase [Lachnospiraceae bacterium]|nr:4-alpha-glucanotransferase [Lachnospiraceae bacterium]
MRTCGILLPVFSLPSEQGIGCFSKAAYDFVDFLAKAEANYWQILPLGPTGYGDSPYQSFSTFAGNPYYIDISEFTDLGLLTEDECRDFSVSVKESGAIDYEGLYNRRFLLLRKAFERIDLNSDPEYGKFVHENSFWLEDYALFMAIKDSFGGISLSEWDKDIRVRKPEAMEEYRSKYAKEADFYKFQQYFFAKQWSKLKKYANDKGIKIIGDIPIYVAYDSSDVWASPELFDLDGENVPNAVAGCPPDAFAATGQLWGNPLYRWDYHKETGYSWWLSRLRHCFKLYDVVRIDHFRGFDEYYTIPFGNETAEIGEWKKGPGIELFDVIKRELGDVSVIAEDLGFLTDSVRELVKATGYPSMKVLQFAFGGDPKSEYLPHNLVSNAVIYTGTHDNETTRGWYKRILEEKDYSAEYLADYLGDITEENIADRLIRAAYSSVCDTCVIPLQDWLNIDNEGRINVPSVLGDNWDWQMKEGDLTDELAERMSKYKRIYGR